MKSFQGKVAAITGAASGIGRALAIELAGQGCALALSDVDEKGLAETAELVAARGGRVTTARVDVADRAQVQDWADRVVAEHGKVNLVFNNAGVAYGGSVEGATLEDYEWIMGVNFWGVVHGTKAFLPYLKASGEGHIVNVSSVFGLFAQPTQSAYNATKFAVRGFTESLRQELDLARCGVSATCVHPGGIKTNIALSARISESVFELGRKRSGTADSVRNGFTKWLLRTPADKAARVILRGVRRDARRVLVGIDAHGADLMTRTMPVLYQRLVTAAARLAL